MWTTNSDTYSFQWVMTFVVFVWCFLIYNFWSKSWFPSSRRQLVNLLEHRHRWKWCQDSSFNDFNRIYFIESIWKVENQNGKRINATMFYMCDILNPLSFSDKTTVFGKLLWCEICFAMVSPFQDCSCPRVSIVLYFALIT